MRRLAIVLGVVATLVAGAATAAEKGDLTARIDAARASVDAFASRAKNHEAVVADVEAARSYLRRAVDALEKGKGMFGLGSVKPEAEQDVRHFTAMAELNVSLGEFHLAKVRSAEELAVVNAQAEKAQTRVKVIEDRKAALEKLRGDAAKLETVSRELAALKTDKALLVSQVEMLMAERKQVEAFKTEKGELDRRIRELTEENARLAEQLGKLTSPPKPAAAADMRAKETAPPPKIEPSRTNPLTELVSPENVEKKKGGVPKQSPVEVAKPSKPGPPAEVSVKPSSEPAAVDQRPLNELVAPAADEAATSGDAPAAVPGDNRSEAGASPAAESPPSK